MRLPDSGGRGPSQQEPLPPLAGSAHNMRAMTDTALTDSFLGRLNGPWHKRALQAFMVVVLAHWAEHLVQAYQVYVLKWAPHQAGGVLGQAFPWLVHSEVLHYGYAPIMLARPLAVFSGFVGQARTWWLLALLIPVLHHIQHALLPGQVIRRSYPV